MPPSGNPEKRDLLGNALHAHDRSVAYMDEKTRLEQRSCPPDPELEALFEDFANSMPQEEAVPFIIEKTIRHSNTRGVSMKFLFGDNSSVEQRHEQVASGWPILTEEISYFAPASGKVERGEWNGLAVDIQGGVWFARRQRNWEDPRGGYSLIVGGRSTHGSGYSGPELGKPKGQTLRDSIVKFCELGGRLPGGNYDEGKERLPEVIARAMAKTIRSTSASSSFPSLSEIAKKMK